MYAIVFAMTNLHELSCLKSKIKYCNFPVTLNVQVGLFCKFSLFMVKKQNFSLV